MTVGADGDADDRLWDVDADLAERERGRVRGQIADIHSDGQPIRGAHPAAGSPGTDDDADAPKLLRRTVIQPHSGHPEVLVTEPSAEVGLDIVEVGWFLRDVGDVGQDQCNQSPDPSAVDAALRQEPGGGEVARVGDEIPEAGCVQGQ